MERRGQTSLPRRVVILASALGELELAAESSGVRCVCVSTAYEAAAEILGEPAAAMVVELRKLGRKHLRLLQVAREMNLEVLAFGTLPATTSSDDLSGVRLVSRGDVSAALERILATKQPPPEARQAEAQTPPDEEPEAEPLTAEVLHARQPQDAKPQPGPTAPTAESLLTPEELAALLGDES